MYSESQHRFSGLAGWKQAVMTSVYFLSPVLGPLMAGLNEKQQSPSCRPPTLHWGLQGSLNNGTASLPRPPPPECQPTTGVVLLILKVYLLRTLAGPQLRNTLVPVRYALRPQNLGSRKGSLPSLGEPGEVTPILQGRPSTQVFPRPRRPSIVRPVH